MDVSVAARPFRPLPRRRARLAAGIALGAAAIAGNVAVYASLDRSVEVLQVARDVPAGSEVTADDVRIVSVDADPGVRLVDAADIGSVVGRFAKVRLVAGSLVVHEALQSTGLVGPGSAVVAVVVPTGALPVGLRERSSVELVVRDDVSDGRGPVVVPGTVVGLPTAPDQISGVVSLSVEVPIGDSSTVAAGDDVRVVLLAPRPDDGGGA